MIKTFLALLCILCLSACGFNPIKREPTVVNHVEYVVKIPPAQLMTIPPAVNSIDVDDPKLSQGDISKWIKLSEDRTLQLENQIIEIAKFLTSEQAQLNEQAKHENSK